MREQHVVTLLQIIDQIVVAGHRVLAQHTIPSLMLLEVEFPVAPFHAKHVVWFVLGVDDGCQQAYE